MEKRPLFREYSGSGIIDIKEEVYIPVVANIINKGDLVIMNGREKSNKSTFAMQLACNVSSGTPFLNTFTVPKAGIVWYFSTEGKDNEFRERIIRMRKIIPVNLDNVKLFCSSQFRINTDTGYNAISILLEQNKDHLPILIIIDSVYSCFSGSLKEDDTVRDFLGRIRWMCERCNGAAAFLYHHLKKPTQREGGGYYPATDQDAYGSAFFGGQADHMFRIEISDKVKLDRKVYCETQRSGQIIEEMDLHLNEPDPFYLSLVGAHDAEQDIISKLLVQHIDGLPAYQIMNITKIKKSLCYIALNELVGKGRIMKGGYGGKYTICGT